MKRYPVPFLIVVIISLPFWFTGCKNDVKVASVSIVTDSSYGKPVQHGLDKFIAALQGKNVPFEIVTLTSEAKGDIIIICGLSSGKGEAERIIRSEKLFIPQYPEASMIKKLHLGNRKACVIGGFDDTGLMYGLMDLAMYTGRTSNIRNLLREIKEVSEKPDVSDRAVSIYTMNRRYWESRFYDENYWLRYYEMLAKNRFNSIVVIFGYENGGFLAPCYPYFFNTDGFADVKMVGITPQEQEKNLDALNKMITLAHEYGIRFRIGIWDHIYRGGVQGGGIPGTGTAPEEPVYGLVWGVTGNNLIPYTKASLQKFVKLVPEIDGIQFRMHNESGLKRVEQDQFWSDVFKMMKDSSPNLKLDLRAKELPESVIQSALTEGIKFRITTKYWMEQMGLPFHPTKINPEKSHLRHSYGNLLSYPQQYSMHWRLWNGGTARILLWGDPEYVRRFTESTHLYNGDGFEINEPLATKMLAQPHDASPFDLLKPGYVYYDYEFERYWHLFQVFGRIGYNQNVSPDIWHRDFELRFGRKAGTSIEEALHKASWVLPRIITSCYPYRGFPMTRGWAEKQCLGTLASYAGNEGSDILQFANPDEEAKILIGNGESCKILPSMNSNWFEQTSQEIDKLVAKAERAEGKKSNKEFKSTITDLKILSGLALYHSRRIPAAVSYRLFINTNDISALDEAIENERLAIDAWRMIINSAGDYYADDLMMGLKEATLTGHWKDELVLLEADLNSLVQMRNDFKSGNTITMAPKYKKAYCSDWQSLFHVVFMPEQMHSSGDPVKIRIKVTAEKGIKWIMLNFRAVNQDLEYVSVPMMPAIEKDVYEATIQSDLINTRWDLMYYFSIMDNQKHGINYPDLNKVSPYYIMGFVR